MSERLQWLGQLRPLIGLLVVDLELAAATERWVRQQPGPWGGVLEGEVDDRATRYARAWRSLAEGESTIMIQAEGITAVLAKADGASFFAFLFDPKTPLGLARLHVIRALPHLRAESAVPERRAAPQRPTGPPITASYEESAPEPVGAEAGEVVAPLSEDEKPERPGLPPPTQPPGPPLRLPTPSPPGPVPGSVGAIPTTPGVGAPQPPPVVPNNAERKHAAPTLTSADQFMGRAPDADTIQDDETFPADDEAPPVTRVHREPEDDEGSAQYAGPLAGATRPTTTLNEASTETAARGVRILAYLDAHADDAHLALLRVSLQTGLSVETLRDPQNLGDDEVDFVAASVRRILGRPLEM